MSALITTTTASFSFGGSGGITLSPFQFPVGVGSLALKMVDTVPPAGTPPQLFVTAGSIEIDSYREESVPEKMEVVTNASRIDTKYGESITVRLALNSNGEEFTPELTQVDGLYYQSDVPFSGLIVREAHLRPFYVLRYTPDIDGGVSGLFVTYGTVAAYKNGVVTIFNPDPITQSDTQDTEVYRVVSQSVVNEEGEWEYPQGWPDNPSYPGSVTPVPEGNTGVVTKRVHEICTINQNNYAMTRFYLVPIQKPYAGNRSYRPDIRIQQGNFSSLPVPQQLRCLELIQERRRRGFTYGNLV